MAEPRKINKSRAEKMTYEKFDNELWMITPKLGEVEPTSFIDVRKLSTLDEELEADDTKELTAEELNSIMRRAVARFD